MRHILIASVLTLCGLPLLAASASADVVVRGPFGGLIVVAPSPVDVRVGPGVFVGVPARQTIYYPPPLPGKTTDDPEVVSKPLPVIRPASDIESLPAPNVLPGTNGPAPVVTKAVAKQRQPISLRDFALTFKPGPGPGTYDVVFIHPISHHPVEVTFNLPAGTPRIAYDSRGIVFDYAVQAVVIRFLPGDKVTVGPR